MIAALLFALAQEPALAWRVEPTDVQLGQPITCVLEVPHAGEGTLEAPELELDYGWAVIAGPEQQLFEGGTRYSWSILALEAGARELPSVALQLGEGEQALVPSAEVLVAGALSAGEDAPRSLPGFRSVQERTSSVRPRHLLWLTLSLGLCVVSGLVLLRRTRKPRAQEEPSELERFQGLDPSLELPLAIQLAELLRAAAERRADLDEPLEGLTDEEWVAALSRLGALEGDAGVELGALLSVCRDIKFAGVRPTRFAIEELLTRSEALLEALALPSIDGAEEEVQV